MALWLVDLDATPDGGRGLLSPGERARGARIACARRRLRWERSRGILRALLASQLDADPAELELTLGPWGKPALAPTGPGRGSGRRPLRFSLSHSHGQMLVAVSERAEVGVDIERRRARHSAEFLRIWTLREARVKCLGVGFGARAEPSDDPRALDDPRAPDGVWRTELNVGPGAFAALAVAHRADGHERMDTHSRIAAAQTPRTAATPLLR